MLTKVYNEPRIFQIDVPLPDNPLRNLNCYVVQDRGENLIIDTGFNRPECREALLAGLAELDANWEKTNLFLTHLHSDHTPYIPHNQQRYRYMAVNRPFTLDPYRYRSQQRWE